MQMRLRRNTDPPTLSRTDECVTVWRSTGATIGGTRKQTDEFAPIRRADDIYASPRGHSG